MTTQRQITTWHHKSARNKAVKTLAKKMERGLYPFSDKPIKTTPELEQRIMKGVRYD